jgi:hypothetical protein
MDGLISGATVCLDVNANGACEAGDILATAATDSSGNATLVVPTVDVGKYTVVVSVPVGAVDADSGAVTTAYTLKAPADQTAVVSPLTTVVQFVVASTGVTTSAAAAAVQSQAGLANSPLANYVAAKDTVAGNAARVLVASIQSQFESLKTAIGQNDSFGTPMTAADIQKAVMARSGDLLTAAVAAGSSAAVISACEVKTSAACKSAIATAVTTLVAENGLSTSTVAGAVALNKTVAAADPVPATPTASFALDWVNAADTNNWYTRVVTSSAADNTPDSNGLVRYRMLRQQKVNGVETRWANSSDASRAADLHWNGSAWVGCTVDTISQSTVRDAQGRTTYNYCDNHSKGKTQRVATDISGKSMSSVFALIQSTRTNGANWGKSPTWFTGPVTASVGNAIFPADSKLHVQADTYTETAIGYDVRESNIVKVSSAVVAAGGDARANSAVACNTDTAEFSNVTLELLVARNPGQACIYNPGTVMGGNGVLYSSGARNEGWGRSAVSLGTFGTAPYGVNTMTSYYTTNQRFRVGFAGGSSNAVTFYQCLQRADNDSTRNCDSIGTGTYAITTLGDARVMSFSGFPAQMAVLDYERVFVERGGQVYWGYKDKLSSAVVVRLNGTAGNAALTQLGLPTYTP